MSRRSSLLKLTTAIAMPSMLARVLGRSRADAAEQTNKVRLIVLDVGGTIVQDRGDVVRTLMSSLQQHGIAVTAEEIGPWRGAAKHAVIEHFVAEKTKAGKGKKEKADLSKAIYRDFVRQVSEAYRNVAPIAGTEEAFKKLRAAGILLATNTGFEREIVTPILARLGWEKYFWAMVASDDVAEGRPAPYMIFHAMETAGVKSVAQVLVAGDTVLDMDAARNAGVAESIGVLSGVGTEEQLKRAPHTAILKSVAELPGYLGIR